MYCEKSLFFFEKSAEFLILKPLSHQTPRPLRPSRQRRSYNWYKICMSRVESCKNTPSAVEKGYIPVVVMTLPACNTIEPR